MEFDNPAVGGGWEGVGGEQSDFSDREKGKEKKEKHLLGSSKKKDKDKKKEKETRYAHLGDESSNDEEDGKNFGKSKKKAFKIGLVKKEKKEKKEVKEKEQEVKDSKEGKKKDKTGKPKLKIKKSKQTDSESDKTGSKVDNSLPPIFGVALELAVERNKSHDGIKLPVVVRECIDYIEEDGLTVEGIYRSSGVKSKVTKLRTAYNSRQTVNLAGSEPSVVASLLKLFLRELPDPVLTHRLAGRAEEVAKMKGFQERREGMRSLLRELPDCNRMLVQWVFVHMGHVIAKEKVNKMTLQNVSIVLSPTMQISHRVLNCIFEHHSALFSEVTLVKYVPPISGPGGATQLPESPQGIEEEMKKQESLLAELHTEISSGVAVSKAREEQLWEQQRIVTQLKRNLRVAKSRQVNTVAQEQDIDWEEEINFNLQTPAVVEETETTLEEADAAKGITSSPEDTLTQEHRVTVQIHSEMDVGKEKGHITVIQLNNEQKVVGPEEIKELPKSPVKVAPQTSCALNDVTASIPFTVTPPAVSPSVTPSAPSLPSPATPSLPSPTTTAAKTDPTTTPAIISNSKSDKPILSSSPNQTQQLSQPSQVVSFSSPILPIRSQVPSSTIPLLPPPPPSNKQKTGSRGSARALMIPDNRTKSKSLPRGLPSDGMFEQFDRAEEEMEALRHREEEEQVKNTLLLEEMRLRFEFEELMTLKSELERRKRTERREVSELQEEIATMQTLYQYRTYSVDSSEESSEEEERERNREQRNVKLQLLARLAEEKKELERKKLNLQNRLQEERAACLQLRVNIRMEQERIRRQKGMHGVERIEQKAEF